MYNHEETYLKIIDWDKRLNHELPLLREIINNLPSKDPKNILDLGCGPGKHLLQLASLYPKTNFYGLDKDTGFIRYANDQLKLTQNETITNLKFFEFDFWEDNMNKFPVFDFIYSLGNSLMLIWGEKGPENVFKPIIEKLDAKGTIFFQILNSDNPRNGYYPSKVIDLSDGSELFTLKRFYPDISAGKMQIDFITFHKNPGENKYNMEVNPRKWNLVKTNDIRLLLENLGMHEIIFWDDYDKKPLDTQTSNALLCKAQKK